MAIRLLVAGFLLAHGAIHASYLAPPPPATATGPQWPFALNQSRLLGALGIEDGQARVLGVALVALTLGSFALAAVAALGVVSALWVPAVITGTMASFLLIVLFFDPWLALGLVIDLVLIWAVAVAGWVPGAAS